METQDNLSSHDTLRQQPPNYMVISIVGLILGLCSPCCVGLITGIVAIVFSSQVTSKFNAGDYAGANSASNNAKIFGYVSLGLGILGILLNLIAIAIMGSDGYMEMIESYQYKF